jgi:hypothetical protein
LWLDYEKNPGNLLNQPLKSFICSQFLAVAILVAPGCLALAEDSQNTVRMIFSLLFVT